MERHKLIRRIKKMYIIGVHIESYRIDSVLLQMTSKQPLLLDKHSLPLSLELNENQRKIEISNYLNHLTQKYSSYSVSFVFSIPQKQISIHDLKFPFRAKFKIHKALPYEMEEVIPFSLDNVVYNSKISYSNSHFTYVLSFVSSRKWVQDFIHFLESTAKITPAFLVPESSSLINLFEQWEISPPQWNNKQEAQADQLNLHLSYDHSTAFVLSQNRVIHIYNINWQLKPCIEQISAKYRRSMDQALDYFFKNAFITQEEGTHLVPLLKIMKQAVSTLQQELKLLFVHLKGMGYDNIQNIHILGPASCIQNLPAHLFRMFKIPVHTFQSSYSISSEYWTALGTALSACKRPKNPPVDLAESLKPSSEGMSFLSQKKKNILKYIALSFIAVLTYTFTRNWQSQQLFDQINQSFSLYSRKIAGLKTRDISVQSVEKFLKKKKTAVQTSKLYNTLPLVPSAMDILKKMSLSLTQLNQSEMELTRFEINGAFVSMRGFISKKHLQPLKKQLQLLSLDGKIKDQTHTLPQNKLSSKKEQSKSSANLKNTIPFYLTFHIKT